jgi:transcriptional regulator with XRE-family HTH domain
MAGGGTSKDTVSAELRLGNTLKARREELGLSLRTLATRAGFSASFLSQLETGQVSPSIASLGRIAAELGLTLAGLFAGSPGHSGAVVRADSREGFTSSWSRARLESLMPAGSGTRTLEAIGVTVQGGGCSGKHLTLHPTDQFVYVVKGSVTLFLNNEELRLAQGDATLVPKQVPHRWENSTRRPVEILLVSSPMPLR